MEKYTEIDQHYRSVTHDWLLDRFLLFACFNFHAQALLLEKQQQLLGASLHAESCMGVLPCGTPVPADSPALEEAEEVIHPEHFEKAVAAAPESGATRTKSTVGEGMWSARCCQVCFSKTTQIQPLWLKVSTVQEIKYMWQRQAELRDLINADGAICISSSESTC